MPLSASLVPFEKTTRASPAATNQRADAAHRTLNVGIAVEASAAGRGPNGVTINTQSTGLAVPYDVRVEWSVGKKQEDDEEPRLLLMNPPPAARVTVNGKLTASGCRLRDDDVLSFRSEQGTHQYKVHIEEVEEKLKRSSTRTPLGSEFTRRARGGAKTRRDSSTPPPDPPDYHESSPAPHPHFSAAAEEFSCVVCLEIQVLSTTLVPCGHSLCKDCAPTSGSAGSSSSCCPTCRTNVSHHVPNKMVDNAIAALSRCPDFFDHEDLAVYFSRSGVSPTEYHVAASLSSSRSGNAGKHAAPPPSVPVARRRGKRCRQAPSLELQGLGMTADDAIEID